MSQTPQNPIRAAAAVAALSLLLLAGLVFYPAYNAREAVDGNVVTLRFSENATPDERVGEILAAYEAHPDKDIVLEPAAHVSSYQERRRRFEKRYARILADREAREREQLAGGVYVEGELSPCASGHAERGLPSHCNGELVFPRNDSADADRRAALSVQGVVRAVAEELEDLLRGVTPEERALGFDSPFSGSGEVRTVRLQEDRTLVVDFSASLADDIKHSSSYEIMILTQQLLGTVFRYPQVESVRFELAGDCEAFWDHLRSDCHPALRVDLPEMREGDL